MGVNTVKINICTCDVCGLKEETVIHEDAENLPPMWIRFTGNRIIYENTGRSSTSYSKVFCSIKCFKDFFTK